MKYNLQSKIISLLALILLALMLCTNVLASSYAVDCDSAEDGDLLCAVNFKDDTGFGILHAARTEDKLIDRVLTLSDDGREAALCKLNKNTGALYYGGRIEGLKMGEGKTYTIRMQAHLPANRGGIFINFPTSEQVKENGNKADPGLLYGIYGKWGPLGDMGAMLGGGRIGGEFKWNPDGYVVFDPLIYTNRAEYHEITFLIEDYSYAVFVNGVFCDYVKLDPKEIKGKCDDIGISAYVWYFTENDPIKIKDVNVYKGDTVSKGAIYPDYSTEYPHYNYTWINTTVPEATQEPETTPAPTTTPASKEEKGCGGLVAGGFAVLMTVALAGAVVCKKSK